MRTLICKSNENLHLHGKDNQDPSRPSAERHPINLQCRAITIQRNLSKIMAANKYTEIVDQVREMYIQGLSKRKISARLDIDQAQIGYILYVQLRIHEEYPRKSTGRHLLEGLPKEKINKIITLTNFGYNALEIANDQEMQARDVFKIVSEAKKKKLIKKVC